MSKEFQENTYTQIRDVILRLQAPVQDITTLYGLLASPLAYLKILPPKYSRHVVSPLPEHGMSLTKHIPLLQRALLEHVLPTWTPILDEQDSYSIVQQYFAPDLFSFAVPSAREIAVHAYSSILALPLTEHSIRLLVLLTQNYPIDVLWDTVARSRRKAGTDKGTITWEDCVRNISAVPGKVANAYGEHLQGPVPRELEFGNYINSIATRFEILVSTMAETSKEGVPQTVLRICPLVANVFLADDLDSLSYLLTKLVNIGAFPTSIPVSPTQPSFFSATLSSIRDRYHAPSYGAKWVAILGALPSTMTLQTVLVSLFAHLSPVQALDAAPSTRALVKREAQLLGAVLGQPSKNSDLTEGIFAAILGRTWSVGHARIFVCWAAGAETARVNSKGLQLLLDRAVDLWTTPDHIKHSLLAGHQCKYSD